ncbi:putative reverse transcriptase zinc-binding domain-containing protein [Helianthus debilis subsp. tardiflorus]
MVIGEIIQPDSVIFGLERHKRVTVEDRVSGWDWRQSPITSAELGDLQQISSIMESLSLSSAPDKWSWMLAQDGQFSVASLRAELNRFAVPFYPYDWDKWVPKKVNIFGWRGIQDRLATLGGLKRRGMLPESAICKLCGEQEEDADHLFTACYVASVLWLKVSVWCKIPHIFAFNTKDLLECYKQNIIEVRKRRYIKTIIITTCWMIWKARNELIFNGTRVNIDAIFGEMQATTFSWIKSRAKKTNWEWNNWLKFEFE